MKSIGILILAVLLWGCQTKPEPSNETTGDMPISAHETSDISKPAAQRNPLKGKVLERLNADRYSYLRLSTASGEMWAAVLQTDAKAGDEVTVVNPMPMDGFESKTLKRKFEKLVFGTLEEQSDQAEEMRTLYKAHAGVPEAASIGPIKVEKARGPQGRTVAEIFAQRLDLKDRKVAVRGKVVKVNANILDRMWIHLQDGTGDSTANTNDLTVTTQDNADVGDTVLVQGTVRTDKNFGMGYVFPVIIEDAVIKKQ